MPRTWIVCVGFLSMFAGMGPGPLSETCSAFEEGDQITDSCQKETGLGSREARVSVGFSTRDITPPLGYRMSGYFNERLNTGVHDPLTAKAMVIRQGEEVCAIVCCDLIGLSLDVTKHARLAIQEKYKIPVENILISATHSHTGPLYDGALRNHFHETAVKMHGEDPHEKVNYKSFLIEQLTAVVGEGIEKLKPGQFQVGKPMQFGLSFNRRFHMKDGSVQFNPGKLNKGIIKPAGPIDPDVGILAVRDSQGRLSGMLTVFALHLDTVGGTEYSGDYPFYYERTLQREFSQNLVSLFGAGTCGDINHVDVSHDRAQKGNDEATRIGQTLAQTTIRAVPELQNIAKPALKCLSRTVPLPLQEYTLEQIEESRKNLILVGTAGAPFLKQVEICKTVEVGLIGMPELSAEVQVFRIDSTTAIVGLPGEVFVDLGLAIKERSPFENTLVMELCQDSPAYIPTAKAFKEGSYETVNSLIKSGGGEQLVETAVELLKELASGEK